jgi:hypothetical protein
MTTGQSLESEDVPLNESMPSGIAGRLGQNLLGSVFLGVIDRSVIIGFDAARIDQALED